MKIDLDEDEIRRLIDAVDLGTSVWMRTSLPGLRR